MQDSQNNLNLCKINNKTNLVLLSPFCQLTRDRKQITIEKHDEWRPEITWH